MRTSLPSMIAPSLIWWSPVATLSVSPLASRPRPLCLHLRPAIALRRQLLERVGALDRIGRARLESPQGFGQPFKLALGVLPDVIDRRRRPQPTSVLHHRFEERFAA